MTYRMPTPNGVVHLTKAPSGQWYYARPDHPTRLVDVEDLAFLAEVCA